MSTFLIFLIYLLGRNFHPWVDSSVVGREGRLGVTGSMCDLEKTTVKKVKKQQLRRLGVLDAVALGKVLVDGVVEEDEELLASLPESEVSIFFSMVVVFTPTYPGACAATENCRLPFKAGFF